MVTAVELARRISEHHQVCRVCQRGGLLVLGPGGAVRERCATEAALLAALDRARARMGDG